MGHGGPVNDGRDPREFSYLNGQKAHAAAVADGKEKRGIKELEVITSEKQRGKGTKHQCPSQRAVLRLENALRDNEATQCPGDVSMQ